MTAQDLDPNRLEQLTRAYGQEMFARVAQRGPIWFSPAWWDERLMDLTMQDEAVKVQLNHARHHAGETAVLNLLARIEQEANVVVHADFPLEAKEVIVWQGHLACASSDQCMGGTPMLPGYSTAFNIFQLIFSRWQSILSEKET